MDLTAAEIFSAVGASLMRIAMITLAIAPFSIFAGWLVAKIRYARR